MIIGLLLIFLVVLPLVYFAFTKIKPMPNCFDRRKNGNEVGIDCGGACVLQCPYTKKDVVVIFARAQKVADGLYNAIALVENNPGKAAQIIHEMIHSNESDKQIA